MPCISLGGVKTSHSRKLQNECFRFFIVCISGSIHSESGRRKPNNVKFAEQFRRKTPLSLPAGCADKTPRSVSLRSRGRSLSDWIRRVCGAQSQTHFPFLPIYLRTRFLTPSHRH